MSIDYSAKPTSGCQLMFVIYYAHNDSIEIPTWQEPRGHLSNKQNIRIHRKFEKEVVPSARHLIADEDNIVILF